MIRTVAGGSSDDMIQQPSRFLNELPGDLADEWKLSNFDPYRQDPF